MFKITNCLLHKDTEPPLPAHECPVTLAENFIGFFNDKVSKIQAGLNVVPSVYSLLKFPEPHPTSALLTFETVSAKEILDLIKHSPIKSSPLDPIPAAVFGKCYPALINVLVSIINLSLREGHVPDLLKDAQLTPILKKHNLDRDVLNNYRPISNLSYLSKLVERVVATQLDAYMAKHNLLEPFQSAYRKHHSTETAIVCVLNDLLCAIDDNNMVFVCLLDCSAAFDLVDHSILLHRLEHRLGITGLALDWFRSYLSGRTQNVTISNSQSTAHKLACGVPQGSVLGPKLFTVYTLPLGDIVRQHSTSFHLYADDTQLYLTCKRSECPSAQKSTITRLEACIDDIRQWMPLNGLKLNDAKTEFLQIQSKFGNKLPSMDIAIGTDHIKPTMSARNLGVMFDETLCLSPHISNICKSAVFQLRQISRIRNFLTKDATKTIVHSLVTSRLDYCNSVLAGLPDHDIKRLQCIQNAAARLTSKTRKFDHISPVLQQLHWLPVKYRITFKILVLTYKALNDLAPPYIKDMLKCYTPARPLRSAKNLSLVVPRYKTKAYGARAFSCVAPTEYNKLPQEIAQAPTLNAFKSRLKTHFFRLAFP